MNFRLLPVPRMLASESPTIVRPSECRAPSAEMVQAVACRDEEIDARGVQRVGQHGYVHVGDVAARAQQLFVPHDELRIESVARAEEQVAPDHPVARQVVEFVARAFQPVAAVVEHLPPFDGDVADRLACIGGQQQALVGDAAVRRWCPARAARKASCRAGAARGGVRFSNGCCRRDGRCARRPGDWRCGRCRA